MNRSSIVKVSLSLVVVLFLGIIVWAVAQIKEPSHLGSLEESRSPFPIYIKGLSSNKYEGNRLVARIKADEFKINPRRFFVFNIRPFDEVTLTNVRLEVHLCPEMPKEVGLDMGLFSLAENVLSVRKGKPTLKGIGLLTRGVVQGLVLKVYKADKLSLVVKAEQAYVDFKKKKTRLKGASVKDLSSDKLITSRSIIWNHSEKVFKIPGEYVATTRGKMARGKGIKLDLDLAVNPLKHS